MTFHESVVEASISGEIGGQVPSPVVSGLLRDDLASSQLCMPAFCSHVESYNMFYVSSVIEILTSDT